MAKRKQKESPFEALKEEETKIAEEISAEKPIEEEADQVRPPSFEKREFSKDELERLDMLDATIEANQKLVLEKEELQVHSEEYLQEIDQLKKQNAALEKQLKQSKDDNDTLLMKISELTFDLAKAQSELDTAMMKQNNPVLNAQKPIQQNPTPNMSRRVPYPRQTHNGYTDWN